MKHKIFKNDQGILELITDGDLSGAELNQILDAFEEHATKSKSADKAAYVLVDATKLGRAQAESRQQALKRLKSLGIDRMGVYGVGNPYAKYITGLAAKALHLSNLKFFNLREEAIAWVNANER